jgi:hypothetical protein
LTLAEKTLAEHADQKPVQPGEFGGEGISCIVAGIFVRISFRNFITIAVPAPECPEAAAGTEEGTFWKLI